MRGGDATGLRAFNERLVMGAVLSAGSLSKAEVARATGLSGQAARLIVDRLLEEGLLRKLDKVRGQVGQPSTPVAADPEGAYALGVKIGRRKLEARLVNLCGETVAEAAAAHAAPLPRKLMADAAAMALRLLNAAPDRGRVVGLGLAVPGHMHEWAEELNAAPQALEEWREIDPAAMMAQATGLAVEQVNDATAACAAEAILGGGLPGASALYLHIGAFIGGGMLLDGRLVRGETGNAAAIGSMPLPERDADGRPVQLLRVASAMTLERMLDAAGLGGPGCVGEAPCEGREAVFEAWLDRAGPALGFAVASACSVYDFSDVVVDGVLWGGWRRRLSRRVAEELSALNLAGLHRPRIGPGALGGEARVLGAALLPLQARFSPDPGLLTGGARRGGLLEMPLGGAP